MNPWVMSCGLILVCSAVVSAEDGRPVEAVDADREVDFATDILPILRQNCLACHSESETEGELVLESAEQVLAGGDSGPAVVPGNAEESLLFQLVTHRTDPFMPPLDNDVGAKPLSPAALGLIQAWIDQGAKLGGKRQEEVIQWKPVPEDLAPVHALDISKSGRWLAAGRGNQLIVYSLPAERETQRLTDPDIQSTHPSSAHLDIVQSVVFSPDERTLVTGGFRCVKVWQRTGEAPQIATSVDPQEFLPADVDAADVVDARVSADKTRLLILLKTADKTVARLMSLPDHQLLKEWDGRIFAADGLRALQRQVGLRQERLRVAQADVDAAKKRKSDDEKHAEKTVEDLKKAKEEVPKRKETLDKAKEATAAKVAELNEEQAKLKQAEERLASLAESLAAANDEQKQELQAGHQEQEKLRQSLQKSVDSKQKELEKLETDQKKRQQEFEGAEKVVVLSEDAMTRAEKMVERRGAELVEAEEESAGFAAELKNAEGEWSQAKEQAAQQTAVLVKCGFLDGGWEGALWDDQGRCARFASENGGLVSLEADTEGEVHGRWQLVTTLGNPADAEVFEDRVTALDFSDDGSMLATGGGVPSRSGEIQLWDTSDWSRVAKVEDVHSDVVYDLRFSPQNQLLASCASDRMVKLLDTQAKKSLRTFEGHTGHVLGVAWRADGRTLVTAGADKVVKVWDAKDGTQKKTISGFKSEITDVCYLGLEDRFVFCVGTGQVESRDSNGGGKPAFPGFRDYVHRLSSSEDGTIVAAAGEDRVIRVWDAQGKVITEFQ